MRTLLMIAALTAATTIPTTTTSAADVPVRTAITSNANAAGAVHLTATQVDPRYRYHNGRWWYYTPQNTWMYHNGTAWNRYQAGAAIAPRAAVTLPGGVNAVINPRVNTYYRGYNNYGYRPYNNYGYGRYYNNYRPYNNYGYRPYYNNRAGVNLYARPNIGLRF